MSIDTLERNYEDVQDQLHILTHEKKVDILVFDRPFSDTSPDKELVGTLLADIVLEICPS